MSLGRGNLMGKVTRCKHSWSRSWWETVASQGQLWSQLYRFELEEKLRSKNFRTRMSPQSQNFTQIPRLFCLISVWMFMFSRRSAVASAFTALQCVEVFTMCEGLPRETAVHWWCLWVPLPFLCQSSHSQSALICPRNRAEKCTKGYLRWQLWSRDICPTLFVEKLTSTMRSICLLYCVLFQWDVESIMDNS